MELLGTHIDNLTMREAVSRIEGFIKKREACFVCTPNVDHLIKLQKDSEFREVYAAASLVVADGMPLLWAAKFLGAPLKAKISGSDLFPELCRISAEKGYRLFFLGGRAGAATSSAEIFKKEFPEIKVVGIYSPPLGFEHDKIENTKTIEMIKKTNPDILFLGLGTPKQEKWIHRHFKELGVPVSVGIGATFDFTAGVVKRAPLWMQRAGLEWFWRLFKEPKRLWKRYLVDDMGFFWLVLKQKLASKSKIRRHKA